MGCGYYKVSYKLLELEIGLANKDIDLVVHSLKDLPSTLPEDMVIGAIMAREDPRDVVVMKTALSTKEQAHGQVKERLLALESLPAGSVIGTSSVRRGAQLRAAYPHLGNRMALKKL